MVLWQDPSISQSGISSTACQTFYATTQFCLYTHFIRCNSILGFGFKSKEQHYTAHEPGSLLH